MDEERVLAAPELDLLDVQVWHLYWAEVERRIGSAFPRSEARARALSYLGRVVATTFIRTFNACINGVKTVGCTM